VLHGTAGQHTLVLELGWTLVSPVHEYVVHRHANHLAAISPDQAEPSVSCLREIMTSINGESSSGSLIRGKKQ